MFDVKIGLKYYFHDTGHMTKMAAMPIYGKKPFKNLLLIRWTDFHETWYEASGTPAYHSCSTDDTGLTLTYFMTRSNLVTNRLFYREKLKMVDFSETNEACDLIVGRCRQLIELMNVCKVKVISGPWPQLFSEANGPFLTKFCM